MIRKFMVGAVAAAMPIALLSTGASAAAPKPPKPAITGVTVSAAVEGNSNGGLYAGKTVGYWSTVTITVTGTALDTTKMGVGDIVITPISGYTAFLGHTGAWTINSVTSKSATGFTVNATADNITWSLLGGGAYATKAAKDVSLTGGGATIKDAGFNLGSNCGAQVNALDPATSQPINSKTGTTYQNADFGSGAGQAPAMFQSFYQSLPSAYTDITVLSTALLGTIPKPPVLCSADLGASSHPSYTTSKLNSTGFYSWAKNYGVWAAGHQLPAPSKTGNAVDVKKGALGNATIGGLSFAFPITTVGGVNVTNSVIRYNIPKGLTVGGCSAATGSDASSAALKAYSDANSGQHAFFRDSGSTTCDITGSVITVTDTADHFFDEGSFLDAPTIKLTGVHTAKAGTYNFTLGGTTSTITLDGQVINIGFNPAPKSKSLTAPFFSLSLAS